jgi:lipopolysaccharide export system ATP-binding protein
VYAVKTADGESKPGAGRSTMVIQPSSKLAPAAGAGHAATSQRRGNKMEDRGSTLIVKGLQKTYGKRQVVHDVSLQVECGEVVGLLGPNGAGKTTSFYMIVGLVPSDAGSIDISGTDISSLPIHRRASLGLSYLPQEASVFRKLTVEENIRAVLEIQKVDGKPLSKAEIDERLNTLLADLQIEKLRENPALSLSGGERRRVEIARALATNPRFVLLDEPFAGVDPIAVIEIQRIVRFLKERGIGVLITDHNVRETLGICDRAISSTRARCWLRAVRTTSSPTSRCAASTWVNTSACKPS